MAVETRQGHTFGDRMPRKEDGRFIRGRGKYVDDLQLPGMLHSAILRSPFAHAKITGIDVSAALEHPKVRTVITGKDLEEQGLAWMPTIAGDTQAVLATDKVDAFGDLRGLHGDKAVWKLIEAYPERTREIEIDAELPPDVDTPEDYERALVHHQKAS